jgi:HSP20 family protein
MFGFYRPARTIWHDPCFINSVIKNQKGVIVMAIIRWSPYRSWLNVNREMENLFDDFFGSSGRGTKEANAMAWNPDVDLAESKEGYIVKADLPGVAKEDVKVTLSEDVLTITGEKKEEKEITDHNIHKSERVYGSFTRSFRLPTPVQSEKIKAEYKDGVLTLSIPKAESVKPREIHIN